MRVLVWKQKLHWLSEWADQPAWPMWDVSDAGVLSQGTSPWVLAESSLLSAPWVGNSSAWDPCWAAEVMVSDGSREFCHSPHRNLNVCSQIKSCLCSLDAVGVGSLNYLSFFCKYCVSRCRGYSLQYLWGDWLGEALCGALLIHFWSLNG